MRRQSPELEFGIGACWEALRLKHARECWHLVHAHQTTCLELHNNLSKPEKLQQDMKDRLRAWFPDKCYLTGQMKQQYLIEADRYVEAFVPVEFPKALSRLDRELKQVQKRDLALQEAESKWRAADSKQLLTQALLELDGHRGKSKTSSKSIVKTNALGWLVGQNPDPQSDYNIKLVDAAVGNPGDTRSRSHAKKQRRSSGKSRSSSQV